MPNTQAQYATGLGRAGQRTGAGEPEHVVDVRECVQCYGVAHSLESSHAPFVNTL